jgi:hypothetical protein
MDQAGLFGDVAEFGRIAAFSGIPSVLGVF